MPLWRALLPPPSTSSTETSLIRTRKPRALSRQDVHAQIAVHIGLKLDITALDKDTGRSLLHWAAATGRNDFVSNLVALGAYRNSSDLHSDTALHTTILKGLGAGVATFRSHDAETGIWNSNGWTALHLEAITGNTAIVECLLNHGANMAIRCGSWTETIALHYAVMLGHMPVVRALIARGADVKARDGTGWTAAECAGAVGREELAVLVYGGRQRPVVHAVPNIMSTVSLLSTKLQLMIMVEPGDKRFNCAGIV